jgi:hypothetical protein
MGSGGEDCLGLGFNDSGSRDYRRAFLLDHSRDSQPRELALGFRSFVSFSLLL